MVVSAVISTASFLHLNVAVAGAPSMVNTKLLPAQIEADPVYFIAGGCPSALRVIYKHTNSVKKRFMKKFNGG